MNKRDSNGHEKFIAFLGTCFGYLVVFAVLDTPFDFPAINQWWFGLPSMLLGILAGVFLDSLGKTKIKSHCFLLLIVHASVCASMFSILMLFFTEYAYLMPFLVGIFATSMVLIFSKHN